jgi:methylenetetrahydrofolate dehydrogenase (NADP+)/methenyltetrahydrofolate cyclohydrolase
MEFDGKKVRDEIIKGIADDLARTDRKPILAEFLIGHDPVSTKYAELKKKMAEKAGITFNIYKFEEKDSESDALECINYLNNDEEVDGIMIQIPVPEGFDRDKLISAISPTKDVDGLRYCLGVESDFRPPVVMAILEAIKYPGFSIQDSDKKIVVIGNGFLVGNPLARVLAENNIKADVIDSTKMLNSESLILNSDLIISATGKSGIIKPEMIKDDVILIDAGTAEENGELVGDIDPLCYKKAAFYTPVPGGIGPVTIAMLFQNLTRDKK